ncbi:MAG: flippase-like domain-containing protein [Helicobacteraceae bacterium]|nr:flippase-like domain-containing protein [Helicobacteraceae bacterium]
MKNIIKLLITIAIFYALSRYINFDSVLKIAENANIFYLFTALIFQFMSTYIAAYRWYLIMDLLVFRESIVFYIKSYFKGSFFNQLLPSSIGGDAIRVLELGQMDYSKKEAFYGIFVDRVVGLVGLLILNIIANFLFYGTFPVWLFQLINIITLSGIAGFIFLMNIKHFHFLSKFAPTNLFYRLSKRMAQLYESKVLLLKHLSVSVVVHIFSILSIYALSLAVHLDLDLNVFLIAIPPVILLTIVPISLAGWGVREGAMVGILMLVGAAKVEVITVSILYGLVLIISSLPGALFWLRSKNRF